MQNMMAIKLNLRILMARPITNIILIFLLQINFVEAQEFQHFKSIPLPSVQMVSIDRVGFFYTAQQNGTIKKFSEDAELVAEFNQSSGSAFDLIEAWNGMRIIGFNRDNQTYTLFDRFLNPLGNYTIDQALSIDTYLCTITGDNSLWLIDQADYSLKKINNQVQSVEVEILIDRAQLQNDFNFNYMREYQNMLFLNKPATGILVFNNIGKQLRTLELPGLNYFNFLGMDLYYVKDQQLHLHNLYTGEQVSFDLPQPCSYVLLTDETMLLVDDEHIHFYRSDLTVK